MKWMSNLNQDMTDMLNMYEINVSRPCLITEVLHGLHKIVIHSVCNRFKCSLYWQRQKSVDFYFWHSIMFWSKIEIVSHELEGVEAWGKREKGVIGKGEYDLLSFMTHFLLSPALTSFLSPLPSSFIWAFSLSFQGKLLKRYRTEVFSLRKTSYLINCYK